MNDVACFKYSNKTRSSDKNRIETIIESIVERQLVCKQLLLKLHSTPKDKSVIMDDYLFAVRSDVFYPNKAAISDITSSGKLPLLHNEELKKIILEYYTEMENSLRIIYANQSEVTDRIFQYDNILEMGAHQTFYREEYGKELTLAFEPGKFLVSEAGSFLCSVNSIKQTTSTVFAQVDSGFNHFVRPMMYGSNHDIKNISNPDDNERFYSVVGYICETDTFANNKRISRINEGDVLCFKNAGAYCFTMASNYNSRYKPSEILFLDNKAIEIRKRENIEDILRNQVEIAL